MKYAEFLKTNDHAYNVRKALEYCKENNITSLEFDKGRYDFFENMATEAPYFTSNHGVNGFKRIAFLLKDMKNFTIDGGSSEFVFHDIMNPFVVDNCKNIELKNFSVFTPKAFSNTADVIATGDGWFDVKLQSNQEHFVKHGQLFFGENLKNYPVEILLEAEPNKKYLRRDFADYYLRNDDIVEALSEDTVRFHCIKRQPPILHNKMLLMCRARDAAQILLTKSQNIKINNYIAYSGIGMGVLAQKCENVYIDRMQTKCKEERYVSLNADATHFVHCMGEVKITNSDFSGQLDDAFNVHGIYTKIIDITKNQILVKYMHHQAKGLDIYDVGSQIQIVDPLSLLPKENFKITKVEVLNSDCTLLTLDNETHNISLGDMVEDIRLHPEVVFEKNKITFNRARGILLGSRKRTIIKDNYFNTAGVAILFESNGSFWFESGGTTDVVIENNIFEDCKYGKWGSAVIEVVPREKTVENRYFHKNIIVKGNKFKNSNARSMYINNVERLTLENNQFAECQQQEVVTEHCKNIITN